MTMTEGTREVQLPPRASEWVVKMDCATQSPSTALCHGRVDAVSFERDHRMHVEYP